ncbi:MAG: bifunctional molybdenum cofactor biosynthesis protein MoaC/MoaB [Crocinitomicaceae bacterium]|nr:bifunctional molybdenum cofactor biosynthesis protein MoaC/MoaB [Crocinitomicaceae bacterium]
MVDITSKTTTLRIAVAEAIVKVSQEATIDAIKQDKVPKGNVFEMSKAAGLLGVKKTPDLLPDCHPMPIEHCKISYEVEGLTIKITVLVKTIYKTGVEVEAMHGASVVALNMYDMLKPIDKGVEIGSIKLQHKKGGKSDFKDKFLDRSDLKAAVIVCSDTISAGQKEDKAGKAIIEKLKESNVEIGAYEVIPDERDQIRGRFKVFTDEKYNLIIFTGGTGLSARDVTPDSLEDMIDRRIPGIEEAIRQYGQERMPYAMLSRSLVGVKGGSLLLCLPGSTKGAQESMDAIFPFVLHVFGILKGAGH